MKLNFSKNKDRLLFLGFPCFTYLILLILILIFKRDSLEENITVIFMLINIVFIAKNMIVLVRYDSKKFKEKHGLE
jgi:phosphatidylserine synthase